MPTTPQGMDTCIFHRMSHPTVILLNIANTSHRLQATKNTVHHETACSSLFKAQRQNLLPLEVTYLLVNSLAIFEKVSKGLHDHNYFITSSHDFKVFKSKQK